VRRVWYAALMVVAVVALPHAPAQAASTHELAQQFMCQCGCGLTLANCAHEVCGPRDQMLSQIRQFVATGKSPLQIRDAFIAQFGVAVLSAPPKSGFNLLAYWGPYAALGAGALVIAALAALWSRRPSAPPPVAEDPLTPEQRAVLTRELERFED